MLKTDVLWHQCFLCCFYIQGLIKTRMAVPYTTEYKINEPLSKLDSVSTCQYVLPELDGYRDLGTS